jgi:hypothetical protein
MKTPIYRSLKLGCHARDPYSLWQKNILTYGTIRFIVVFTQARHWTLSWASWIQFAPSIPISLRSILMLSSHLRLGLPSGLLPSGLPFRYNNKFLRWGVVSPTPNPKLEHHPLSAVRDCLFNIFAATLRTRRTSLHPQPEDSPYRGDKGPT